MSFLIRRGQSVNWRMMMVSGDISTDMAGGSWGVAETTLSVSPSFVQGASEARLKFTPAQTTALRIGRKKLRLKFTQANGEVKVFPDIWIMVE